MLLVCIFFLPHVEVKSITMCILDLYYFCQKDEENVALTGQFTRYCVHFL